MSSLAERLDSFPEAWKPAEGDKLMGELADLSMRESEYGDPYPILTVQTEEGSTMNGKPITGEYAWHAFHTMSRSEVKRRRPQIGERVGISYHGQGVASPGMSAPEKYRLLVDRPKGQEPPVDWDKIAPDDAQPAADEGDSPPTTPKGTDNDIPF
jgi:hypothetical protein